MKLPRASGTLTIIRLKISRARIRNTRQCRFSEREILPACSLTLRVSARCISGLYFQQTTIASAAGACFNRVRPFRGDRCSVLVQTGKLEWTIAMLPACFAKNKKPGTRGAKEVPVFPCGLESLACVCPDGELLHGNGLCCFVNVAFAVPCLKDCQMSPLGHADCGCNVVGGSGSDADVIHVNAHKGDGIGCSGACRQTDAWASDRAACGRGNLDQTCGGGGHSSTVAHKELMHVRSGVGSSGKICRGSKGFQHGAQNAGMMVSRH